MDYIVTDPVAWTMVERAVEDMGRERYLSALLLDGPPGTGKSYLARYLAHKLGATLLKFQFFPGANASHLLVDPVVIEGKREPGILPIAARMSQDRRVVLLTDELDKTEEEVDSFLLNFLEDGELFVPQIGNIKPVAQNFIQVITKNDRREVSRPLMRRCRCARMRWPDLEVECAIVRSRIPEITPEAARVVIDLANFMRKDSRFHKPPSSPELVRLIKDLARNVAAGHSHQALGDYLFASLAPFADDHKLLTSHHNILSSGTRVLRHLAGLAIPEGAPLHQG